MASSSNSPCAACKFLRRKCTPECVFAPYFPPDSPQKFANVHKVFGASNVSKLLTEIPPGRREDAVNSLAYEADARLTDPVYGCVGVISLLQHQLKQLQCDLQLARTELTRCMSSAGISGSLPPSPLQTATEAQHQQHYHQHHRPSMAAGIGMGMASGMVYREQQLMDSQQMAVPAVLATRDRQETMRNYDLGRVAGASYDQGAAGSAGGGLAGLTFRNEFGFTGGSPPPPPSVTFGNVTSPLRSNNPEQRPQIRSGGEEERKPCSSNAATCGGAVRRLSS